MKSKKNLYYQVEVYKNGDYRSECLAEDLKDVGRILQYYETKFDDTEDIYEVRIKGIGLTKEKFEDLKQEEEKNKQALLKKDLSGFLKYILPKEIRDVF